MKKSPRFTALAVLVVALCLALLQNRFAAPAVVDTAAGTGEVEQGVVLDLNQESDDEQSSDVGQGGDASPGGEADQGNEPSQGSNADQDSETSPTQEASPNAEANPSTPDLTNVDLGEDLELNEGITDKRKEQYLAAQNVTVKRNGTYTSKVEVALYIHTYGTVPSNYISKTKAREAGWVSNKGNLDEVLPGKSIGGGGYFNESWDGEPLLPETPEGRNWHECDINYTGGYRGAERIVYSDDGLVFYTGNHYETFERLY